MCRLYRRYVGTSITHLTERQVSCSSVSTVPNDKEIESYENIPNTLVAAPVTHLLCIMCALHASTIGCASCGKLDMNYHLILSSRVHSRGPKKGVSRMMTGSLL